MKNKQDHGSLKWKITTYLVFFSVLTLVVIFLFQIVLLETMYENSKIKTIKEVNETVSEIVSDNNLSDDEMWNYILDEQMQTDTCIRVVRNYATTGEVGNLGCALYRMTPSQIQYQISQATASSDESFLYRSSMDHDSNNKSEFQSINYTKILHTDAGDAAVIVNTGITPLNATTSTLRKQLVYIAIFLLLAVIILARILYQRIADPLIEINKEAKNLSHGEYNVNPDTNRYTEAAQLNETLSQAAVDIQKADQAERDLIANVSHDLRTPLTMIKGYGEMMQDLPEEKTDENLQVIIDEASRLNYLVNDLLNLSKLQSNAITIHQTDYDLSSLLRQQLKKYEVYTVQEGFHFSLETPDSIMVHGDEQRIAQVVNNFLINAIHYSGNAKDIEVKAVQEGNMARVSIRDHGEGIAPDDLKNIWNRYYKVDKQHVRNVSGSGIGLAIVQQILKLHDVPFGVNSKVNEGSEFWFDLPVIDNEESKA